MIMELDDQPDDRALGFFNFIADNALRRQRSCPLIKT
jgi:hypothetical protein